ncbi:hypothetical protein [Microcoleus sp. B5-D4]
MIIDILGTEGARLPEAEFFWQTSIEFRTRLNHSKGFRFILGEIEFTSP